MRFFDCTTYFDEELMMDVRFNLLDKFVEKFIVVESIYSHSGIKKKLNFKINNYSKFKDKIVYLVIENEPEGILQLKNDKNDSAIKRINSLKRIEQSYNFMFKGIQDANDEDIIALVDDSLIIDNKINAINLKSLKVFAGTGEPQKAEMTLDVFGEIKKTSQTGDGPVDATFKCIKALYPHDMKLLLYQVHAVTEGTDAQATVSVKIEENDRSTVGQSADTDTLVASANAYLNALNKMLIKREKKAMNESIKHQKVKGI